VFGKGDKGDPEGEALAARGLQPVERRQGLSTARALGDGEAKPSVCQTPQGVFLVTVVGDEAEILDLRAVPIRVESGLRLARLVVQDVGYDVPFGGAARLREALAVGSLVALGPARAELPEPTRHIGRVGAVEGAWLRRTLHEDEVVLAWLESSTSTAFVDSVQAKASGSYRLLVTDRRALLVALSEVGDVLVHALPAQPLTVHDQVGRDDVGVGEHRWRSTLNNGGLYAEVAALPGLARGPRLRELARVLWLGRDRKGRGVALARELLGRADGDALSALAADFVDATGAHGDEAAIDGVAEADGGLTAVLGMPDAAAALVAWAVDWQLTLSQRRALVRAIVARGAPLAAAAVDLHRAAHADATEGEPDELTLAQADLELAQHLVLAGQGSEARTLVEARLAALSPSSLDDLVAPEDDAALAAAVDLHTLRLQLLELVADDPSSLARLAQLSPLDPWRLDALIAVAPDGRGERAALLRALLREFPRRPGYGAVEVGLRALGPSAMSELLAHPASRGDQPLSQLQQLLSRKVEPPDPDAVRTVAEVATDGRYPELMTAVRDAAVVLRAPVGIEVFVQRAGRTHGIRAHEGSPPMLLVGLDHVDPNSPAVLPERELRFVVGAEIAHLVFGHARLTSRNLWDDVWEQAPRFLELLLTLGPLLPLKGAAAAGMQLAGNLPLRKLLAGKGDDVPDAASFAWKDLLAACRLMQLTADRAGLLLSDDILAATRGVFRSHGSHAGELALAERHGLGVALLHRDDRGEQALPSPLALRIAALWAFYLSDEWPAARAAARAERNEA